MTDRVWSSLEQHGLKVVSCVNASKIFIGLSFILLVILVTSLALNITLFNSSKQYYIQLNGSRLDPMGLSHFPTWMEQEMDRDSDNVRVVFFGDSRAAEWPDPSIDGFEFINRGIGAQTSVQVSQRYDDHVKMLSSDILVIQVCINDLKVITIFPENKDAITARCKDNIRQIVQKARDQETIVVLSTIFPVGQVPVARRLFWSDEVQLAVNDVNDYIKSIEGEGVVIFDTFSILADESGKLRHEFSQDELHLNSKGYDALNKEFEQLIKSYGGKR